MFGLKSQNINKEMHRENHSQIDQRPSGLSPSQLGSSQKCYFPLQTKSPNLLLFMLFCCPLPHLTRTWSFWPAAYGRSNDLSVLKKLAAMFWAARWKGPQRRGLKKPPVNSQWGSENLSLGACKNWGFPITMGMTLGMKIFLQSSLQLRLQPRQ